MPSDFLSFLATMYGKVNASPLEAEFRDALAAETAGLSLAQERARSPHMEAAFADFTPEPAARREIDMEALCATPGYQEMMAVFRVWEEKYPLRAAALEMRMLVIMLSDVVQSGNPAVLDGAAYRVMLERLRHFDGLCETCESCPRRESEGSTREQ